MLTIVEPIGETTTIATAANGRLFATTTGGFGSVVASDIATTNVVPSPQPEISLSFGRVQTGFTEVQDGDVYLAPSIYGQFARTFEPFHITNTGDSSLVIYEVSAVGDFGVRVDVKGQFEDDEPRPLFPYAIQPGSRMALRLIPTSPINGIGESQLVIRSDDSDEGEFDMTVQGRFFNGATAGVGFRRPSHSPERE